MATCADLQEQLDQVNATIAVLTALVPVLSAQLAAAQQQLGQAVSQKNIIIGLMQQQGCT